MKLDKLNKKIDKLNKVSNVLLIVNLSLISVYFIFKIDEAGAIMLISSIVSLLIHCRIFMIKDMKAIMELKDEA